MRVRLATMIALRVIGDTGGAVPDYARAVPDYATPMRPPSRSAPGMSWLGSPVETSHS